MRKIVYIVSFIGLAACQSEEIMPEKEFFGTYELAEYAIYDEYGDNILDYIYLELPLTGELTLNRDGTYYITDGYQDVISFLNSEFYLEEKGVYMGVWEISAFNFGYSFHFDRGIFESAVEFGYTADGLNFFEPPNDKITFELGLDMFEIGYTIGERMAIRANNEDNTQSGRLVGNLYGFYEGYFNNSLTDEFGLTDDLIYKFAEGFLLGFDDTDTGVSTANFNNGFNETYPVGFDSGQSRSFTKDAPENRTFLYSSDYYFIAR